MSNRSGRDDKGKIITYEYDRLASLVDVPRTYELTTRTRDMLLTSAEYLKWHTRYVGESGRPIGTDEERANIIQWSSRAIEQLMIDLDPCSRQVCTDYPPCSPNIEFHPMSPCDDPEEVPPNYVFPPFYVITPENQNDIIGSQVGDIMTDITKLPPNPVNWLLIAGNEGFPRFRVSWVGDAHVELHLLGVPQGGLVMIVRDDDPTTVQFATTNTFDGISWDEALEIIFDLLGVTAATDRIIGERILEYDVLGEGDHHFDVTFLPLINADIIYGFGGGLRKVTICTEGCEEGGVPTILRQNPEDTCQLEYSINDGETWHLAFDYGLCVTPAQQIMLEAAVKSLASEELPGAPGSTFIYLTGEGSGDVEQRRKALCFAVRMVVDVVLDFYIMSCGGSFNPAQAWAAIAALAATFALALTLSIALVLVGAIATVVLAIAAHFCASFTGEDASDPELREHLYCIMYSHLLLRVPTYSNFVSAFDSADCYDEETEAGSEFMAAVLKSPIGAAIYPAFMNALSAAYFSAGLGVDLGECDICPTSSWCFSITHENFHDYLEFYNTSGTNGGQLWTGGLARTWSTSGNQNLQIQFKSQLFIPAGTTITMIRIDGHKPNGTVNMAGSSYASGAGGTSTGGYGSVREWFQYLLDLPRTNGVLRPRWSFVTNAGTGNGQFLAYEMRIHGTGVPPFGACNGC